jgi:hypothetical protein
VESAWALAVERAEERGIATLSSLLSQDLAALLAKDLTLAQLDTVIAKARRLIRIIVTKERGEVSDVVVELLNRMIPEISEQQLSLQHLYQSVFSQKVYLSSIPDQLDSSLLLQSEVELKHLTRPNIALFLVSVLADLTGVNLPVINSSSTLEDTTTTITEEERVHLPTAVANSDRLMAGLAEVTHAVVYLRALTLNRSISLDLTQLELRLSTAAARFLALLSRSDSERLQRLVYERSREGVGLAAWPAALAWLLGLAYRSSEWDLLADFLPADDAAAWQTDGELNTTAAVLELIVQLNAGGHGAVSATLGLELGRLISLGGLETTTAFPIVWLIAQCIRLTKCVGGLHVTQTLECREEVGALLDLLSVWRNQHEDQLLYDTDLR